MENKILGMLIGAGLGDALGVPHEFPRMAKFPYTGKLEHSLPLKQPFQPIIKIGVGMISDDTAMMLTLARSIVEKGGYDTNHVLSGYIKWANSGNPMMGKNTRELFKCSAKGVVIKNETYVKRFIKLNQCDPFQPYQVYQSQSETKQSNGSLMRSMPLACIGKELDMEAIGQDVWLSNPSRINYWVEYIYLMAVKMALKGYSVEAIWSHLITIQQDAPPQVKQVFTNIISNQEMAIEFNSEGVKVKGWSVTAFYTTILALYHRLNNPKLNYQDLIGMVISLGGDTDTNGCIAGGLIGALDGYELLESNKITSDNIKIMLSADLNGTSDLQIRPEYLFGTIDHCRLLAKQLAQLI